MSTSPKAVTPQTERPMYPPSLKHSHPPCSREKPASADASLSDLSSSPRCRTASPSTGGKGTAACSAAHRGRSTQPRGDRSSHAMRCRLLPRPYPPPAPRPSHFPPVSDLPPLPPAALLPPAPCQKKISLAYLVVPAARCSPVHSHCASSAASGARKYQRTWPLSSLCTRRWRCGRCGSAGKTCRRRRGALRRCGMAVWALVSMILRRVCVRFLSGALGEVVWLECAVGPLLEHRYRCLWCLRARPSC